MKNKIILIIFIVISFLLGGYIIYDKVNDNKNTKHEFPQINVEILSMDNPIINVDIPDGELSITGKMNISYDEDYSAVTFEGYCVGENGEHFDITGPSWGTVSFYSGDTEYSMTNTLSKDKINWNNVRIKLCRINSATAYITTKDENTGFSTITYTVSTNINYEKTF